MIKTIGLGLFVAVVGVVLGIRAGVVRAGDGVDCSSASKWTPQTYNKGAFVAYKAFNSTYHGYKCDSGKCFATEEPAHVSSWKDQGQCKAGTEPK